MFALAGRPSFRGELLGLCVLAGLVVSRVDRTPTQQMLASAEVAAVEPSPREHRSPRVQPPFAHDEACTTVHGPLGWAGPSDPVGCAQQAYRAKHFAGAAAVIRERASFARAHGLDEATELESLAELYEQLVRAWSIGMHVAVRPVEAYPALREAWKLDTVLGGAFTDELYERMKRVAPKAALQFIILKDYAGAEQALHTAEALGIHSVATKIVADGLAMRR